MTFNQAGWIFKGVQIGRMSEFKGVPQDKLKLHFLRPEGKISRRELLKLVLPRYEVVPFIEPALCRGSQECGLCLDTCPLKAIRIEASEVIIDTTLCSGCGACIAACPYQAISYPTFSLELLDKEMEALLTSESTLLEPGIMAFVCQKCLLVAGGEEAGQLTYPSKVLPLRVPCLAMASPWLLLRAFDRGAQGLALISSREKCPAGFESNRWQENVRFAQGVLNCWGIEPERIRAFDFADDYTNVARRLEQFAKQIAGLGSTPLIDSEPTLVPSRGLLLPALIKDLVSKLGGSSKGVVTTGMVPFGKLELDGAQCTGCGLCAAECPTEALTASSSVATDDYQLFFQHDLCVACGRCVEVCPEKCLRLERILELDKVDSPPAVLFEDRIARCRECGSVIGPRAMIDRLQAKLQSMGESFTSQLELCPVCKAKARFAMGRTALEPTTKPERNLNSSVGSG